MNWSKNKYVTITLGFILFLFVNDIYVVVPSGNVGVVRRLGAVQPIALEEGFHLKIPVLDRVSKLDIRLRKIQHDASASSKDLQVVRTTVAVQYSINHAVAEITFQKIGAIKSVENTLIAPAIMESVKAITAKYTAEELITKRAEVKHLIHVALKDFIDVTLREKKVSNAISIANVAITDFDFSDEFNRAIEAKVRAEQEALQAKNEKLRRVTQAEASAAEIKLGAEAEAFQIEIASKARAAAIRREAEALANHPELIQLRIAEKWNGQLPQVSGGEAVPLLNLGGLNMNKSGKSNRGKRR